MLKGDLATAPLPEVLRNLAASSATGCLRVRIAGDGGEAKVFLRAGSVYAVVLPDRRPQLGPRLVSSGDLDPAGLAEAYDAQRTELQGWRLGELLVHLGYVEQDVVEAAVGEQLREAAFELLLWTRGVWRFRRDEKTREDVAPPVAVEDLLADVAAFTCAWEALRARVHGPDAIPVLSAAGTSPDTLSLDGDAWSLLCTVDGTSTLSRLAGSSGLSLLEAAQVVVTLLDAGLVEIEPPVAETETETEAEVAEPEPVAEPVAETPAAPVLTLVPDVADDEPADDEPAEDSTAPAAIASRLAEALRGLGPMPVLAPMAPTVMDGETLTRTLAIDHHDDVVGSLSRASESLADVLGETDEQYDPLHLGDGGLLPPPVPPLDEKEAVRRARDAQELAEQQAALEAEHAAQLRAARAEMSELFHQSAGSAELPDEARTDEDAPAPAPDGLDLDLDLGSTGAADELTPVEDAARQRLVAQLQAAAFAELSEAANVASPPQQLAADPEPDPEPEPEPEPEPQWPTADVVPAEVPDQHHRSPDRGADTAALLRELSSLGLENEPEPVPQQRSAAPPVVRPLTSVAQKKRKGLFGRG